MEKNKKIKSAPSFDRLQLKDFFTLACAGFGFLAIWFSLSGSSSYLMAGVFVMLAVVADHLDGFVARRFGTPNAFGRELDSLADAVAFGVAPAFLALRVAGKWDAIFVVAAVIYVWACLIRLARYNLYASTREAKRKYYGLPAPLAALALVVIAPVLGAWVPALLLVLSALMLSGFELKKI